jgi:branched-chain amino acid transport system permease protein
LTNATRRGLTLAALALLIAFPLVARQWDQSFYVSFASRIMIYAIAATSLNLILGYGGMLSFGHAAYLGAGAYTVAILMQEGVASAWIAWPAAMLISAMFATAIGAICLRTRGVYFIMITLAFAQMMYYLFISLRSYGGEDGFTLARRSVLGLGLDGKSDVTFYYVALAFLVASVFLLQRLAHARFGSVLEGIRENETRMRAIGFPTYRYKLIAFAIAGAVAGLAGALLANQNSFVSPALLHWSQSGTLMIMVILGGVGRLYGGVLGAAIYLILEEVLSARTIHWQLGLGIVLLAVVLYARGGIAAIAMQLFARRRSSGG